MTTPCGYYVDASDLTVIFKPYLYGSNNATGYKANSNYGGKDLSGIFQPVNTGDPDSQINYNTNFNSSSLGGDLRYYFMDINYPIVKITASGFDSNLSICTVDGAGVTTDPVGMLVFTNTSATGSITVNNFPTGYNLNVIIVSGGGGGGGGGAQAVPSQDAGAGGGGGGGNIAQIVYTGGNNLILGQPFSTTVGVGGGGGEKGSGTNSPEFGTTVGNDGIGGNSGGSSAFGSTYSAAGGTGGGGGGGSGNVFSAPTIVGGGGGGGSGNGNGGSGDSGNASGGNNGSVYDACGNIQILLSGTTYNLYLCGGGGGGSEAQILASTQFYKGGLYGGGQGGASANNSGPALRTGNPSLSNISSWTSTFIDANGTTQTGVYVGGGGGGGSGAMNAGGPGDGFDGGSGAQGIVIIYWSISI